MSNDITIIGWDAASEPIDNGIISLTYNTSDKSITNLMAHVDRVDPHAIIKKIRTDRKTPILIAIDCPLGWPVSFQQVWKDNLPPLPFDKSQAERKIIKNEFFRRESERYLVERFKCSEPEMKINPLEVSASWLGRTAFDTFNELFKLFNERHTSKIIWSDAELREKRIGIILETTAN